MLRDMTNPSYPDALPALSRLHWYVVERVLGQGGFGITYLARDTNLDQAVAIKENLPVEVATRMADGTIRPRTDVLRDGYRLGLERFIQEARTLARFDHPNIVRVLSVFEFNGTAYMVMRLEKGGTLGALLDRRGTLPESELLRIVLPILDGLELVHGAGFIHRDIKPDNIHIGDDGRPVLLDFGSARQALGNSRTLTILVAPGYAPFEQYYSDSASQGPWTDIYGLGATCYRAIAGRPPLDAVSRSKGILGSTQDVMVAAGIVGAGRYSGALLAAIDHALAFSERDRPQTIADWRAELTGGQTGSHLSRKQPDAPRDISRPVSTRPAVTVAAPMMVNEDPPSHPPTSRSAGSVPERGLRARKWPQVTAFFGAVVLAAAVAAYFIAAEKATELGNENQALKRQLDERRLADAAAAKTKELAAAATPSASPAESPRVDEAKVALETQARPASMQLGNADQAKRANQANRPTEVKRVDEAKRPAEAKRVETKSTPTTISRVESSAPSTGPPAAVEARAEAKSASQIDAPQSKQPASDVIEKANEKKAEPTIADQISDADRAIGSKNYTVALATLKPLADAGNAQAQRRLGNMSVEGLGAARDYMAAEKWFEKAALQGDVDAQIKLGTMYENGTGLARNNNLAYLWYGIAAGLGSSAAKSAQERVSVLLQPAERTQADKSIESSLGRLKKP